MANWTESQVRAGALTHLGIMAAGEAASGEDDELAQSHYVSLYADLHRKGLAPFPRDAVPEWAQTHLAHVLGGMMLGAFGFTGARRQVLESDAKRGMRGLQAGSSHLRPAASPAGVLF